MITVPRKRLAQRGCRSIVTLMSASESKPADESGTGGRGVRRLLPTRRGFLAFGGGTLAGAATGLAVPPAIGLLASGTATAQESDKPVFFEDIPEDENLIDRPVVFRIAHTRGGTAMHLLRTFVHDGAYILECDGTHYQSFETMPNGTIVTHRDMIQSIHKKEDGIFIDANPVGTIHIHLTHILELLRDIVRQQHQPAGRIESSVRARITFLGMPLHIRNAPPPGYRIVLNRMPGEHPPAPPNGGA